jgi:hypothetical protein
MMPRLARFAQAGWHVNGKEALNMARRSRRPPGAEELPPDLAHNTQKTPAPGTSAADLSDTAHAPPEEPGVSVEAMEVGVQFLRDATEQYNFESQLRGEDDHESVGAPIGQMISDATLESANQQDFELPLSEALADDQPEVLGEPDEMEIDLTSDAIRGASLFDRPISELEDDEEAEDDTDDDTTLAAPFREPHVRTDDPSEVDEEKQQEIQREFDERVQRRLALQRLQAETQKKRNPA